MFLFAESGVVLDVNRRACESLLYSESELIGMRPADFDPYVTESQLADLLLRLSAGETVVFESVHRRRDGFEFPVEVRMRPFEMDGQRMSLALASDITERRKQQVALEKQREFLLQAQKLAGLGCYDWDLITNDLWWSDVIYEIFDLKREEFPLEIPVLQDRILPEDFEPFQKGLQVAIETLQPFRMEYRVLRPSGEVRTVESRGQAYCNEQGQPFRFLGVCWDVTERKAEDLAARATEAALRRAHRIAELEGWTFNCRSGRFHYPDGWNRGALASESFNEWLARVHLEDRQRVEYSWSESLAGHSREFEYRSEDARWVRTRTEPLLDGSGSLHGLAGTTQDVTEQHNLQGQLREAQKMEAIGRLAGGVAHAFNNLLSVINGYAELLIGEPNVEGLVIESGEAIREAGTQAAALTAQLLAFSRKSPARPTIVDLNELIRESVRVLGPILGENIELQVELEPNPTPIRIDADQFRQIVMSLVLNARDAMDGGGTLTLRSALRSLTRVQFSVHDTGAGMSDSVRERIFEPFFTTKELGQGSGLGLAVVHALVERWDGHITVESEPGQGTTFWLSFPLADQPAPEVDAQKPPASRWGTETVLLVEDDDGVRRMAARALERSGYTVLHANSGSAALELAAHGQIQVLVTDLIMPGMGGIQLAEILRSSYPEIKVLYMSGYSDEHLQQMGVHLDSNSFLKKPLTPSGLLQRMRELLA
jgi:two-component system cell cycle sensor histidine kinase/response regulator CckA